MQIEIMLIILFVEIFFTYFQRRAAKAQKAMCAIEVSPEPLLL